MKYIIVIIVLLLVINVYLANFIIQQKKAYDNNKTMLEKYERDFLHMDDLTN